MRRACAEAVEELKAARTLLLAQGAEIEKQKELLTLEREISAKLKNINAFSQREKEELRKALAATDRHIAALESANTVLKKQKFTFWKAVKVAAVAAIVGAAAGAILANK